MKRGSQGFLASGEGTTRWVRGIWAGPALVQLPAPRRVPGRDGDLRRRTAAAPRVGGAPRPERAHRANLTDPRTGHNRQFPLADLFRQSVYSRLAGYEDTNDAERLAEDPVFRMLASRERRETSVALTSTLHWFETEVLADERNCQGLSRPTRTWCSTRPRGRSAIA
jgi:Transposase DDE domain group 1